MKSHLHNRGDHADVHHDPAESQADPVLAEIHGESVGKESAGHTSDRKPHTVEAELGSPVRTMALEDPGVEKMAEGPAWNC